MSEPPTAIPNPPRAVRWTTVLQRNALVGILGALALLDALVLGLVLVLFTGAELPFDDLALDSGATSVAGVVTSVERGEPTRVRYAFTPTGGARIESESWTGDAPPASGSACTIEHLPGDPATSRITGTRRSRTPAWQTMLVGGMFALGFVLLALHLRGALRLRIALANGRLTSAKVLALAPRGRWLRVAYRFTDVSGETRQGGQWTPRTSQLGAMLAGGAELASVIHDEIDAHVHRLVATECFHA